MACSSNADLRPIINSTFKYLSRTSSRIERLILGLLLEWSGPQDKSLPSSLEPNRTSSGRIGLTWRVTVSILVTVTLFFGLVSGLVEGIGLLLFQKIHWQQWGVSIHVALPILWISPLFDLVLFGSLAAVLALASPLFPKLPVLRIAIFLFVSLTLFDWFVIPKRLHDFACFVLALGLGVVISRKLAERQATFLRVCRRTLPILVLAWLVMLVASSGDRWLKERTELANLPAAPRGSPNVVLIIIDTLRADHVSSYGYSRQTTPNIDRLAKQGVLFENAISPSSWSFPAHVSLLTGEYSFEHGLGKVPLMPVFGNTSRIIREPLIGEELAKRGYRTGAFSANRVYFTENVGFGRGFMHFEDYFFSPADEVLRTVLGRELVRWVFARKRLMQALIYLGLQSWVDWDSEGSEVKWKNHFWWGYAPRKRAEEVNREALHWIGQQPTDHPFFVVLNYFDVHLRYGGPPLRPKTVWALGERPEDEPKVDQYDDGLFYADACVGEFMAELAKRQLIQNTLVVITADHGELIGEHGIPYHGRSLYWNLIHVPLIFWFPGRVPAGMRVPNVVSTARLPATLNLLLPGRDHLPFPGAPLAKLWEMPLANSADPPVLSEISFDAYEDRLGHDWKYPVPTDAEGAMKSLVKPRWHFITNQQLGDQLYDWSKDPQEMNNLIYTPEGRDIAAVLRGQLINLLAGRERSGKDNADPVALDATAGQVVNFVRHVTQLTRIDDRYRVRANSGSLITFGVRPTAVEPTPKLNSVLTLENADGTILETCRNPGDDNLPPPGVSDPTPEAFDDLCVNGHAIPGVEAAPQLELQVPGRAGTAVDLRVRITDWEGSVVLVGTTYQLSVSSRSGMPALASAAANQKTVE